MYGVCGVEALWLPSSFSVMLRCGSRLGAEVKNTKDAESAAAFCRLNRALIQGQQLVSFSFVVSNALT